MQGHVCGAIRLSARGPHRRFVGTACTGPALVLMVTLNVAGALAETIAVSTGIRPAVAESQEVPNAAEVVPEGNISGKDKEESRTIDLLTADLNEHWKVFSSAPTVPETPVWKIVSQGDDKELVLVCSGEPKGFLYTKQVCTEFELTLEWKYPIAEDGNSGVLVYTQDEPRIWPTSMQVQLHQPKAGSVFPSGDATSDQSSELENDLARPVDTWNEVRILSRKDGHLSVEVNGRKAGEVTGANPSTGSIALQSEGSVVHFRRIRLKRFVGDEALKRAEIPASVSTP
ncbi:MAG: DUF1080 domain-containing protein [Planctomycetaceae bacterium]